MTATPHLAIDKASPVPLYHQITQALEDAIRSGELIPGTRLEAETDLAARLHLSRPTVRRALKQLVRDGLLVRNRQSGTHVTKPH